MKDKPPEEPVALLRESLLVIDHLQAALRTRGNYDWQAMVDAFQRRIWAVLEEKHGSDAS